MSRKEELAANLERVRAEIAQLADAAGRPAPQLLPVTKFHPAGDIALLSELGVTDVAENREQEARAKHEELVLGAGLPLRFHMIGQVQTKKANHVARWAASCHSVDSVKLAAALDRGVALAIERGERGVDDSVDTTETVSGLGPVLPVFIQVSMDADTARGGVALDDLDELVDVIESAEHLHLEGLMVVPPLDANPADVFARVRELADGIGKRVGRELTMSAGMSADMADAIAAGTNIVRVGTGIMGPRPLL